MLEDPCAFALEKFIRAFAPVSRVLSALVFVLSTPTSSFPDGGSYENPRCINWGFVVGRADGRLMNRL